MRFNSKKRHFLICSALIALCGILAAVLLMPTSPKETGGRSNPQNQWNGSAPKYVFMFIGDGMGPNQVFLAETILKRVTDIELLPTKGSNRLSFTDFESKGMISTHSANSLVTDSAAAATALATGRKTKNGMLGLGTEKQRLVSIAELSKRSGKRVGIITTVSLNHATPAAYYAHVKSRYHYYEIGMDMLASGFDYFAGGGLHKHDQSRKVDLYDIAKKQGLTVLKEKQPILQATYQDLPILAINPELNADNSMPYSAEMTEKSLSLAEFVRKGYELLDNKNGFFMVIEGGKIDWAAHENKEELMIPEILAFSEAVDAALAFAAEHHGETLIVVTADHETGGLARMTPYGGTSMPIRLAGLGFDSELQESVKDLAWTTKGHTSAMVDVYATGVGSELFGGRYDNTDIAWKLINIMRLQK